MFKRVDELERAGMTDSLGPQVRVRGAESISLREIEFRTDCKRFLSSSSAVSVEARA